jgi:hypothetical protein
MHRLLHTSGVEQVEVVELMVAQVVETALAVVSVLLLLELKPATSCVCLLVAVVKAVLPRPEALVAALQVPATLVEKFLTLEC